MLVKFLGIIDLIAGLILLFGLQLNFPFQIPLLLGTILILKSTLGFLKSFGSGIDFFGGLVILSSIFIGIPMIIILIHGILIIQKGFLSLLAN